MQIIVKTESEHKIVLHYAEQASNKNEYIFMHIMNIEVCVLIELNWS